MDLSVLQIIPECTNYNSAFMHIPHVLELTKRKKKKISLIPEEDYNIGRFGIDNVVFPKFVLLIKSTSTVRIIHIIIQSLFSTVLLLHRQMLLEITNILRQKTK